MSCSTFTDFLELSYLKYIYFIFIMLKTWQMTTNYTIDFILFSVISLCKWGWLNVTLYFLKPDI